MKFIKHENVPMNPKKKATDVDFSGRRLIVWLSRYHQLIIERGDQLGDVAKLVQKYNVSRPQALRLAALWFALGERAHRNQHGQPWRTAEQTMRADRRYLMDGARAPNRSRSVRRTPRT